MSLNQKMDNKSEKIVMKSTKGSNKGSAINCKEPTPKRPNSDVSPNTSVEEMCIMQQHIEGLAEDVKSMRGDLKNILKKDEMEIFIKTTIKDIVADLNENMELTISIKVEEKTKNLMQKLEVVQKENEGLKKEIVALKREMKDQNKIIQNVDKRSKDAHSKANYNEQYSRKNNLKIMDMPMTKLDGESEVDLISEVSTLMNKDGVEIDPSKIVAIHRIPGKVGHEKPILIKLSNNNEKTKIMTHRSAFKAMGRRLVDDVTKCNAELITRLTKHSKITQAWYYNGSVYGRTTTNQRHKFDLYDDIDEVISA